MLNARRLEGGGDRPETRKAGSALTLALSVLAVLTALLLPDSLDRITPAAFLRLPVEAVVLVLLLAIAPARLRPAVVLVGGLFVGLTVIGAIADMGARKAFARPFDPVLDWNLFPAAFNLLTGTLGRVGATLAAAATVGLALLLLAAAVLAVGRIGRAVAAARRPAALSALAAAALWGALLFSGAGLQPRQPVAAAEASRLAVQRVVNARASLADMDIFREIAAVDAFRDQPADRLLAGLAGKDVLLVFVESYGRDALENPRFSPEVTRVLADGDARLARAGLTVLSAFLTSPTVGGQSWLAHGTVLSGLWIGNQQRYDSLVASDRFTLIDAFQRAGWRTVAAMPAITMPWPEGATFGYEAILAAKDLGYRGKPFDWVTMPDQYVLSTVERRERGPGPRRPLMAEIALVSSHAPWTPLPSLVPWADVGDGTVFTPQAEAGDPPDVVWRDTERVRTQYRLSIEYSLATIVSYAETFGGDDLVMIVLGDHQPAPLVTGADTTRDVPVHIIARDPAVLNRIADWGFAETLIPPPTAPVWRMDALRDRLLTAFGADYAPAAPAISHPAVPGFN